MKNKVFQTCCCTFCTHVPILWRLSKDIIWFEIPKNGSKSIKQTYNTGFGPYSPPQVQPIKDFKPYKNTKPYIILRDPIDRFISLFYHYFTENGMRISKGKRFFERLDIDINTMNMNARLDFLIDNLKELSTEEEVHHFYPQTHFIDTKSFSDFNLVSLKDLSKTLDVPMLNHTEISTNIQLNIHQKKYIKTIYENDYRFFKKNSWEDYK